MKVKLIPLLILIITVFLLSINAKAGEKTLLFMDKNSSTSLQNPETVWTLVKNELVNSGFSVEQGSDIPLVYPEEEILKNIVNQHGISRIFIMNSMPLGKKVVLGLEERKITATGIVSVFAESAAAENLEEANLIIPRLTKSVTTHQRFAEKASIENITSEEGREYHKKYGQFLWGGGILFGADLRSGADLSYGLNLKALYEMDYFRIDCNFGFQGNGDEEDFAFVFADIELMYLFSTGNITPFVGGGLGFAEMYLDDNNDEYEAHGNGLLVSIGGGIELFRFYSSRLMFDVKIGLPLFNMKREGESDSYVPVIFSNLSFVW
jgi:hypothetical protein